MPPRRQPAAAASRAASKPASKAVSKSGAAADPFAFDDPTDRPAQRRSGAAVAAKSPAVGAASRPRRAAAQPHAPSTPPSSRRSVAAAAATPAALGPSLSTLSSSSLASSSAIADAPDPPPPPSSGRGTRASAGGVGALARLRFSQRLVPITAARPIPVNDLLRRLQELHSQLARLEQDSVDRASLAVVRKDLVSHSLLHHKERGVRAFAACCLADILRLFAPDAPYKESELKEIFEFLMKQVNYIADSDSPYFVQYFYLVESLSTVKSVVLVADLNAEDLVERIFKDFFDLIRPDIQKNIYNFLLDILHQLVEECQVLSQEVVETVVDQMTQARRAENSAAHQLAVDLCNLASDKLQRPICQFFSDAMVRATKGEDEDDQSFRSFQSIHEHILDIHRVSPGVLLSVIPLLEEELKYDDTEVRGLATDVLGQMMSAIGSTIARTYTTTWRSWLDRGRNDKQASIRSQCLKFSLDILRHHRELSADLCSCLEQKSQDPDEKVRLQVVNIIGAIDRTCEENVTKELLLMVAKRGRDKKAAIRVQTVQSLAALFKEMFSEPFGASGSGEVPEIVDKYGWIPGSLLDLLFLDDSETTIAVERAFHEQILPPSYRDDERTSRLLMVLMGLNDRLYKAFMSILDRQASTISKFQIFLDQCQQWNGGIVDENGPAVEAKLNQVVYALTDPKRAAGHLLAFAKDNNRRAYTLLKSVMDDALDYKDIIKCNKELTKLLQSRSGLFDTFSVFLRRISRTLVPRRSMPYLLSVIAEAEATRGARHPRQLVADRLVKSVVAIFPGLYQSDMSEFVNLFSIMDALEAVAKCAVVFPDRLEITGKNEDALVRLALSGTVRQASKAATIIAKATLPGARQLVVDAILRSLTPAAVRAAIAADKLRPWAESRFRSSDGDGDASSPLAGLDDDDDDNSGGGADAERVALHARLAALAQLARHAPETVEPHLNTITAFVVKELLLQNRDEEGHEEDFLPLEKLHAEGALK
ncbi:hypothetical protein HK405_000608, partial [Cladochytrium tenue]